MRYESEADLTAEAEIASAVMAATGLSATPKLPLRYVLDCCAIREGKATGFFEIKDRKMVFGEGNGGLYLSLFKVLSAELLELASGVPCFLVVRFSDGDIHWCSLRQWDRGRGVFWFGRADRDADEAEPCVAFPWAVFRKVA